MTAIVDRSWSPRPEAALGPVAAGRCARSDVLPLAAAVLQFAVAIGATIATSDVDPVAALSGAAILSAGAAQLAALDLLDAGAGVAVAVGTAVLINVRFVLYGVGFARWFAHEPRWRRLLMVFPIVDQSFLLSERRFAEHDDPAWRRTYYLVVCAGLFSSFLTGQLLGYFAGDLIPPQAGLQLAGPLVFAGLLATSTTGPTSAVSAVAAAATFAVVLPVGGGLTLPVAAVAGLVAGTTFADRRTPPTEVSA